MGEPERLRRVDAITVISGVETTELRIVFEGVHSYPAESCAVCACVDRVIAFVDPTDPRAARFVSGAARFVSGETRER